MRTAIFTGTFDPFTIGHADIVERALPLFDRLIIGVAESALKQTAQPLASRVEAISRLYEGDTRVSVISYSDLTIDLARREGARFLVRGVRSVKDFEYERQQAEINRQLGQVETVFLLADPRLANISSSLVRELAFFGKDTSMFIPHKD